MRTRVVTEQVVAEIADGLHKEKSRIPTVEDIRAKIKGKYGIGGSNHDISAFRRSWMLKRGFITQDDTYGALSDPVAAAVQKIHVELQADADEKIAEIQRQANANIGIARAAEQKARTDLESVAAENERLKQQVQALSSDLQQAKQDHAVQKTARELAERIASDAQSREQSIKRELVQAKERSEGIISQKEARIAELTSDRSEMEKRWENERGRSEATIVALKQQLAIANTRLAEAQEESRILRARNDGHEKELRDLRTRTATLTERVSTLSVQLEEATKARTTAEQNLNQSTARVTKLEDRLLQQQSLLVQMQKNSNRG